MTSLRASLFGNLGKNNRELAFSLQPSYVQSHRSVVSLHESVVSQLSLQATCLERLCKTSQRLYNMHRQFAEDIATLIKEEQEKATKEMQKFPGGNDCQVFDIELSRSFERWLDLSKVYGKFAEEGDSHCKHLELSTSGLKLQMIEVGKKEKQVVNIVENIFSRVDKSSSKNMKKIMTRNSSSSMSEENKDNAVSQETKKTMKNEVKDIEKTFTALNRHIGILEGANEAFSQYRQSDMIPLLKDFETVGNIENEELTQFWVSTSKSLQTLSGSLQDSAESIQKDMSNFQVERETCSKSIKELEKLVCTNSDFYQYESLIDTQQLHVRLKTLRFRLGESTPKNLDRVLAEEEVDLEDDVKEVTEGVTIEDTLKLENTLYGFDFEEPIIVAVLLDKIVALNGHRSEGIFRMSSDYLSLKQYREEMLIGKYTLDSISDPNLPAELLKSWLRGLKESLIPPSLYEDCIRVGSNIGKQDFSIYKPLVDTFPKYTLKIVQRIAGFVKEATKEENSMTRMSAETFGIVFAPGLLRSPSKDLMVQLANNSKETAFVGGLFTYLIRSNQTIDSELDPNLKSIIQNKWIS